ncbi:MAG: hypothetical protein M1840_005197 [Geoglossum simile]|nr:MAG: hypothetical protein M1840_005197 [Geoglossum simile]
MESPSEAATILAELALQIETLRSLFLQSPGPGSDLLAGEQQAALAPIPDSLSNFELHYSGTVKNILTAIIQDLSSHKHIHVWDESIERDKTKKLAAFAKSRFVDLLDSLCFYYGSTYQAAGAYVLSFSAVDEVRTIGGRNRRQEFQPDRLFRTGKVDKMDISHTDHPIITTPRASHGRIICTQEAISDEPRVALLLLHMFCLRLHDEDFTFIRSFIERHLTFEPFCEDPYRPLGVSPSTASSGKNRCPLDREFLGLFGPDPQSTDGHNDPLYHAASSVLLTLVVPDSQASSVRTEGHPQGLWTNPEAVWAVLIFNGPKSVVDHLQSEPVEFLTPIAQFVRGVCAVICSQRVNLDLVFERLKERLRVFTVRLIS